MTKNYLSYIRVILLLNMIGIRQVDTNVPSNPLFAPQASNSIAEIRIFLDVINLVIQYCNDDVLIGVANIV